MKKLVLATTLIFAMGQSYARIKVTSTPELGLNLSGMAWKYDGRNVENQKPNIGFKAGVSFNVPLKRGLFIQSGTFYSMKGAKLTGSETVSGQTFDHKNYYNLNYLEVPLSLGYEYNFENAGGIFVTAGPYIGFALSGKVISRKLLNGSIISDVDEKVEFGSDEKNDDMKSMDYGANFSVGYKMPFDLFLRTQYSLGLRNLSNIDKNTLKNNTLTFSVGYAF